MATWSRPLLTVFLTWLWLMAGANLAAPLYAVYARDLGFGSLVLTTVFATYAVTLVLTLLLCGRLADRIGRRPVIVAGLVVACVALVVFLLASGTGWLYAARALQGVAVGLVSGPATAALVELDPLRDEGRPALLAGLAQAAGSALGPLLGGGLAEWAPAPLRTSFVVVLVGTALGAVCVWTLPEPAVASREPWRIQWPRVPAGLGADFARVGLTAGLVWGAMALYFSVVPSYVGDLLSTRDLALLGANSALACVFSAVAQVLAQRRSGDNRRGRQAAGLCVLTAGLVLLVASASVHSLVIVLTSAVVIGTGHGLAFHASQDELNAIAPDQRRAEVAAAFVCCIYVVVGSAVVGVGLLGEVFRLTTAVAVVGSLLAAAALATAAWQRRAIAATVR